MKVAVLVLVLANFAVFAWLRWARPFGPPSDTGLAPPVTGAAPLALLEPGAEKAPGCIVLGPAADASAATALAARLRGRGYAAHPTPHQVSAPSSYWVLLTGFTDAAAARQAANQLRGGGVHDLFLLDGASGGGTSISLGLFRDLEHARRRAERVRSLGFSPEIRERFRSNPRWYVEIPAPVDATALAAAAGTALRPASCTAPPAPRR